jgi:hypothetical protein
VQRLRKEVQREALASGMMRPHVLAHSKKPSSDFGKNDDDARSDMSDKSRSSTSSRRMGIKR